MTRLEIFDDIVRTVREDASFCKDLKGGDAQKYRTLVRVDMSDREFSFLVNRYLATFSLMAHLGFGRRGIYDMLPLRLRQYKGELFVVEAPGESGIKAGDKLIAADGLTIDKLPEKYPEFFFEKCEDRLCIIWRKFLTFFDELTFKSPSKIYSIKFPVAGELPYGNYKFNRLRDDICYLLFNDFEQEKPIADLISEHSDEITNSRNLIIDVRNNDGGLDAAFLPLLNFCLKESDGLCGKPILPEDKAEYNYTENNVKIRLKILERYRGFAREENLPLFDSEIERNKTLCGKGFVTEESDGMTYPLQGTPLPERVFILADCNCASSGDSFVQIASTMEKVTVIGRPTMGILDYSNLASKEYGNFALWYPTSRRLALDGGKGMRDGLPVDVFVPWTPEFLERDKDLEKVFEIINRG